MKITVVSNIKAKSLMRQMGIFPGGPVQKMLVSECYRHMQKYTPFQTGILSHGPQNEMQEDGVLYNVPYARNMYFGKVMVDPVYGKGCFYDPETGRVWSRPGVRKVESDRPIQYHGSPMRGSHWDVRMWADKRREILTKLAKRFGGRTL